MKKLLLVSFGVIGSCLFSASPAAAQQACDLNGVIQPPPSGTTDVLLCGTILAEFVGNNRTLIGSDLVVSGDELTALGSNVWLFSRYTRSFFAPYDPPASEGGATSVGSYSFAFGSGSVAVGDRAGVGVYAQEGASAHFASVADGTAIGSSARVSADQGVALGANSSVTAANSVALGTSSIADQANTVSIGTVGGERRIVNLATGVEGTDAVNVNQLNSEAAFRAAADTTLQNDINVETITRAAQITEVQSVNISQSAQIALLGSQISAFDTDLAGIQSEVGTLFDLRSSDRRDMKQGIATAIAMGQAAMPSQPGRVSYVVNGARFRGEGAVGGSMMYRLKTASPMAVGGGFSYAGKKNNAVRVGVAGEF
jgi:trimeric autotransporter adhesin